MALLSMSLESLNDLFIDELRDLYDAENQLVDALPRLNESATNPLLKTALREHLDVTYKQILRLEHIFQKMDKSPTGKDCEGMKGIIKEGDDMASRDGDPSVIDAAIISAAQRAEHYEIAGYGTVRVYADLLECKGYAELLQKTLDEEKEADKTLNDIANTIQISARAA
jgi:ferritin-like metal-binding protein YciE